MGLKMKTVFVLVSNFLNNAWIRVVFPVPTSPVMTIQCLSVGFTEIQKSRIWGKVEGLFLQVIKFRIHKLLNSVLGIVVLQCYGKAVHHQCLG